MTPEQEQGNRKIAELVGLHRGRRTGIWLGELPQGKTGEPFETKDLKYHSDANWQDSVLKKISELGYGWKISFVPHAKQVTGGISNKDGYMVYLVGEPDQPKPEVVFELLCKFL